MFTVLHGEDEFERALEVARLKGQVLQPGLGDLNLTVLDGRRLTVAELINACSALPFLASRKLVLVENMLQRYGIRVPGGDRAPKDETEPGEADEEATPSGDTRGRAARSEAAQIVAYLPTMPPSTQLVFSDDKALAASNPVLRLAKSQGKDAVREFNRLNLRYPPDLRTLEQWIAARAKGHGVDIRSDAAAALITLIGNEKRALDSELQKLAGYVGYARPITAADVQAVTTSAQEARIFDLMDALGRRERKRALDTLAQLYADDQEELGVLAMIARQVRLMMAAKELMLETGARQAELEKALHVRDFVAKKLLVQAEEFDLPTLDRLLRRILELDQGIKTGRTPGRLGLELLLLEACQRRRAGPGQAPAR